MAIAQQSLDQSGQLDKDEPVTVAILNYNGKGDLGDAIRSVQQSTYRPVEILLVDDGSTDGSVAFVNQHYPEVRTVSLGRNSKMLNQVRNYALREAKTRLAFLMDHDVVLDRSCLATLVSNMSSLDNAAVLTTRALYADDPSRIYVDAQRMHFLCNAVAYNRDGNVSLTDEMPKISVGWGTQLIDKSKAAVVGYFDEEYVMGSGDDGEFHHKILLSGFGCYNTPKAIVYHKRTHGADRVYGGIRNRWYIILETYALKTIVVLMPALVLYEVALFSFLCLKGHSKEYLRAMRDTFGSMRRLLSKRRSIQRMRARPDRELLVGGPIYIRGSFLDKKYLEIGMTMINGMFDGYWRLAKRFI